MRRRRRLHRVRPQRRGGVLQHLQPCSRRTVRKGRKKDGDGAGEMEEGAGSGRTVLANAGSVELVSQPGAI